jgi:hypothetical protein
VRLAGVAFQKESRERRGLLIICDEEMGKAPGPIPNLMRVI